MPFDGVLPQSRLTASQVRELKRGEIIRRWKTRDDNYGVPSAFRTFDSGLRTFDNSGNHLGRTYDRPYRSHDGKWYDSTGSFFLGELVRLDQTTHLPLASVSWGRDVDLRQDVTIGDDATSWTLTKFAASGSLGISDGAAGGKSWIGKTTTQVVGVAVDLALQTQPLNPWAIELKYTIFELESALRLGRPIDQQKYLAMQMKQQFDIDAAVYAGDSDLGFRGLVNQEQAGPNKPGAGVITNLPDGISGSSGWFNKTPDEILADFNFMLNTAWQQAGWAVIPNRILLPPAQYGWLATHLVSIAGTTSILNYIRENNLLARSGQAANMLEIYPCKWLMGAGEGGTLGTPDPGGTDRAIVYTKDSTYLRYPMTSLARTQLQYDGIYQKTTYYNKLGVLEVIYPDLLSYFDGI